MGLKAGWFVEVENLLSNENIQVENLNHARFHLLFVPAGKLILNLVPLSHSYDTRRIYFPCKKPIKMQNIHLIHLWEDVFITRQEQVLSRIKSFLGLNKRIHGRSTVIEKISKEAAAILFKSISSSGKCECEVQVLFNFIKMRLLLWLLLATKER